MFFFFKQKTAYEISACLVGSEMCIRDRASITRGCRSIRGMRSLPTLAAVTLVSATSFAGQPLTMAPTPDGGMDIRDGKATAAHVALKTAALRRGQPRLRELVVDGHRLA